MKNLKQSSEIEKFYAWMEKINSAHLSDFQGMDKAFLKVIDNEFQFNEIKNRKNNLRKALYLQGF